MKFCLNCGAGAYEDAAACLDCGRPFAHTAEFKGSEGAGTAAEYKPTRPDGAIPKGLGIALMVLGVVLAIWAGSMSVTSYSYLTSGMSVDADKLATKAMLSLVAEGSFALGLVLWLAGYVVYAISFLPGRTDA